MIAGVVRDERGQPVAGARVYVVDAPVAVPDIAALTDASGRFAIGVPAPGRYTVESVTDGRQPVRATVEAAGARDDVEVSLRFG